MTYIKLLQECSEDEAGTKGFNLLQAENAGATIPRTLCIPASAFDEVVKQNPGLDKNDHSKFELPLSFQQIILPKIQEFFGSTKLVVRSSATCEDSPFMSFAGNYSSFLNISGNEDIIRAIKLCYLSMFSQNAAIYAKYGKINLEDHRMAVLIQSVEPVVKSGVLFTQNPVTSEKVFVIEHVKGLGDSLVNGSALPITKFLDPRNLDEASLDEEYSLYVKLVDVGLRMQKYFLKDQDIEWGLLENNRIVIFQSRPITPIGVRENGNPSMDERSHSTILLRGLAGSQGYATGVLHIQSSGDSFNENTILYLDSGSGLDFLQNLTKIEGLITPGGMLSHIAVIARELGIPCVCGIGNDILNYQDTSIAIDGTRGLVLT